LQPNELPLRPGFGTVGKDIKLRANFFPVKVPKGPLFEYNVSISPAASVKRVKRRIFQLAEQTPEWRRNGLKDNFAHDHSQKLITARKLPQPLNIKVRFYDEDEGGPKAGGKEYVLTLEFSGDLNMQNLHKCAVPYEHILWLTVRSLVIWRVRHNTDITTSCPLSQL
jgi:eukaryotic translation initiation factor 2C